MDEPKTEYLPRFPREEWPSGCSRGVERVRYTHDAMIDQILLRPTISQNELASFFGYTASWVSQVLNSDAFQAKLAERKNELIDPTIRASIEERLKGMMDRSIEILQAKLDDDPAKIPAQLALSVLSVSSKALGFGARPDPRERPGDVNVQLNIMGDRLVDLLRKKKVEAIEGEVK